ncbi:Rubrerythrin [Natronincola peptidivorans]|uniref:Rubrerythrin n=1 Tax=Natronincola peptidivorans TaxID=426128 RepID=A0A1I0BWN6_9FIRM|nr:ferritin family protein [Natronincola peptidivorans]SET11390.1 Rubrerythrin [Natronincola peptidivorans]
MLDKELDIIKQAILNEVEGFQFYQMAAKQAHSKESKEAFLELAEEELKHADYLRLLFDSIKTGGKDDMRLAFISNPPSPNLYQWKKEEAQYANLAMSVFGIGMQLEQASIDFYEKAKENTEIEVAKELYEVLLKWERVHLEEFTKQYNIYKEDWWSQQGFSPF